MKRELPPVEEMELALLATWPPLERSEFEGMVLGASVGVTGRANSACFVAPLALAVPEAVAHVERWYRTRGLPPRFRLSPLAPLDLHDDLVGRGWRPGRGHAAPTDAMWCDLTRTPADEAEVEVLTAVPDDWALVSERSIADDAVIERMLAPLEGKVAHAIVREDGAPVAAGRAVLADRWLAVQAMYTRPNRRRSGIGSRILTTVHRWGLDHGAEAAFLNVPSTNAAAIALYEALGYARVYAYRYLEARSEPASYQ